MRREDVAPRTWLLVAVAGWALLAWLLALAGLGRQVGQLPEDPALLQALPQLGAAPRERLGPAAQYGEIATRPLFTEDRRPKPFSLSPDGEGEGTNTFDYILTSVLLSPQVRLAIIQPSTGEGVPIRVKLGEAAEQAAAWRLVSLEPRTAVFEGPEGQRSLELRAFDGSGGQPATPASEPVAAASGGRTVPPAALPVPPPNPPAPVPGNRGAAQPATAAQPKPPAQPAPVPAPGGGPTVVTPDAQIEAIRQRIQARREQLRREAQQPPAQTNSP